jgi:hypothetical protein
MVVGSDNEAVRRRRSKNVVLAVVLGALVVLFYMITVVKLTANVS